MPLEVKDTIQQVSCCCKKPVFERCAGGCYSQNDSRGVPGMPKVEPVNKNYRSYCSQCAKECGTEDKAIRCAVPSRATPKNRRNDEPEPRLPGF